MEIFLRPSVRFISLARRFVYDVYTDILKNTDLAWRLGMATHELLENAVKYASDAAMTLRITTETHDGKDMLVLSVSNQTTLDNARTLAAAFEEMERFKDPSDYYEMLVKRASERELGSGLGLGRIRMEASMTLTCHVENEMVCIKAMTPIS